MAVSFIVYHVSLLAGDSVAPGMEALVGVLQLGDFDLRNSRVRSAALTLKGLLEPGRNLSPENETLITSLAHAFICKMTNSPGG